MTLWEDSSSHAWTEKEELADLVAGKVRSDLGIDGEGSSRSYDVGGMKNDDEDHAIVSKSRKLEDQLCIRRFSSLRDLDTISWSSSSLSKVKVT